MAHTALADSFAALIDPAAPVRQVAGGFGALDGPVWHPVAGHLVFSDMLSDIRRTWAPGQGAVEIARPTFKGSGMTLTRGLDLLVCEHATNALARIDQGGGRSVLCTQYQGRALNSPHDVVVAEDGSVFFTDPTLGRKPGIGLPRPTQLGFQGVYRLAPDHAPGESPQLVVPANAFRQPTGLCLVPGTRDIWVSDSETCTITRLTIAPDGNLVDPRRVAGGLRDPQVPGRPMGLKADRDGHLFVTGPGGVWVYDPEGALIGKIAVPMPVENLHWGGAGFATLYLCGRTALFALDTLSAGHPEPFMAAAPAPETVETPAARVEERPLARPVAAEVPASPPKDPDSAAPTAPEPAAANPDSAAPPEPEPAPQPAPTPPRPEPPKDPEPPAVPAPPPKTSPPAEPSPVREVAPQVASAPPQPAPIVEAPRPVAPTPPRRPEPVRVPPPPPTPAPRPDAADPDAADPDADEVNPFGLQPLRARLEPSRCALVLVDLQNDMISPGGAFADSGAVEHAAAQQVAANAARLLAAARRLGVLPVHVWTLHAAGHPQLARHAALMQGVVGLNALVAGTWGAKPVRGLEPARGEDIVEKTAVSGWEGTRLETLLRSARRDTILVGGAWTNTGVEHLVRTGADKGFRMIVAEEACASMGADWHRAAIEFSLGAFADLARVQDVLDALNDHLDIT